MPENRIDLKKKKRLQIIPGALSRLLHLAQDGRCSIMTR